LEGRELVPTSPSLVERVRGAAPATGKPVRMVDEARVGKTMVEKLAALREPLAQARVDWLVVTKLHEIAWLTHLPGHHLPSAATTSPTRRGSAPSRSCRRARSSSPAPRARSRAT